MVASTAPSPRNGRRPAPHLDVRVPNAMTGYSIFSLARHAFSRHARWPKAFQSAAPKRRYKVVVIGGGGHGLATAFYLASVHGIRDVAVLERGAIGLGNTGRNTTIVRADYLLEPNTQFYAFSLKLWKDLSQTLNFNVMFSPRGRMILAHNDAHRDRLARLANAMLLAGTEARWLEPHEIRKRVPALDLSSSTRFPVVGAFFHATGGVARHDAVAWGYARAADALGVDIVQQCEVTGIKVDGGRVLGVDTTIGNIEAERVGIAVAGSSSQVARMAGIRLPIESHVLQAFVTEPVKPVLDTVVSFGAGHCYVSQTDKGEVLLGGDLDGYNSYAQRGGLPIIEGVTQQALTMFPSFSRLRIMRSWGGIMDMTMDGSPIIGKLPVDGLYIDGGWCYGGFKATPAAGWCFASTIANDEPHSLNAPFTLDRFHSGRLIDERGAGANPALH